ncbi:MAG: 3-phosphoshikimate 1-carboxyvinyltransferase [Planctomycetota bacterium]|nr:3-phosphoshikimate 1-carboxyvinyltransferase [Planctomycetota bacterium]
MSVERFIELLRRPLADLPHELEMRPLAGPFDVRVRPPGSKSITNRVLLLAALAEGESVIDRPLVDADDARVMIDALRALGARIEPDGASLRVRGTGGRPRGGVTLNLMNAGTATRFLTAAACLADAPVVIDGNQRMRQRPIGELAGLLRKLGITVEELGAPGCVPLRVHPARPRRARLRVGATSSSQFISALMLIAPLLEEGLALEFVGEPTSRSYIDMTASILRECFGVRVRREERGLRVERGTLSGRTIAVEPDASGATYFWAAAALLAGARCTVEGVGRSSVQGDARFVRELARLGADVEENTHDTGVRGSGSLRGVEADLTLMPDAAMTLAAVACLARGATVVRGLRTLRVKETDRLAALANEISKLGVGVQIFRTPGASADRPADEGLTLTPPAGGIECGPAAPRTVFDTYDDHRMAMSLALVGLRRPGVVIRDPACVAKTYPTFWNHLAALYESAAAGGSPRSAG